MYIIPFELFSLNESDCGIVENISITDVEEVIEEANWGKNRIGKN